MARGRNGMVSGVISVLILALAALAVIYFFFPDLSVSVLGTSWKVPEYRVTDEQRREELAGDVGEALADSGADEQEIERILSQIDPATLREAAEEALAAGGEQVEVFIERLDDQIDFGDLDTQELKDQLEMRLDDVDFSAAMTALRDYAGEEIESMEQVLKGMFE